MRKLNCYLCDACMKVLYYLGCEPDDAKTADFHFCNNECRTNEAERLVEPLLEERDATCKELLQVREENERLRAELFGISEQLNALKAEIEQAPVAYGIEEHGNVWTWRKVKDRATHKARLVRIETLEKLRGES